MKKLVLLVLFCSSIAAAQSARPVKESLTVEQLFVKYGQCTASLQTDDAYIQKLEEYTKQLEAQLEDLRKQLKK